MTETAAPPRAVVRVERDGPVGVVIIDNPPVNASSGEVRRGLLAAIETIARDPALKAAVVIGAGTTFIAGADIREFGKPPVEPQLPAVIAAIEACPKRFVAAIHGAALGGGYELALGCDARIAAPGAVVGLPEVKLGIIPGAGGTQRMPRLVGVATAIDLITSGRRVPAKEALQLGLVDRLSQGDLRPEAVELAINHSGGKRRLGEHAIPVDAAEQIEKATQAAMKKGRGRPAVVRAIEAVRASAVLPIAEGLARERAAFLELRDSEEAAALRHLFFAEREAARVPCVAGVAPRSITSIGVVGAGTMGGGIAIAFADAGFPVTLIEKDQDALDRGVARIRGIYDRSVAAGRIDAEMAAKRVGLIRPGTDLGVLASADLIVEAVFEDIEVKQQLLRALDTIAKEDAILASNTSYLNLDTLAAATSRPANVVGLHFFSPANVMRLLEIVRGNATAPATLATALAVGRRIGKVSVVARVCEGFIGNRIYNAYRTQCEFMLEEGAYPEQVDAALEEFGFAMGPFAVGDLSGLDIAWRTRKRLAAIRDPRARCADMLDRLCEAGRFGQKAGAGWYRHAPGGRRGTPDLEVRAIVEDASARKRIVRRPFSAAEIVTRALGAMVNEAALLLVEGIAQRPSDVDLVMVHGYGFPDYRGGPLFWASRREPTEVIDAITAVETATGFGFRRGDVEALLERMGAA